ncbi:hypothetical protein P3G55_20230 [Leptospira sp. 96542]|nr:hypothetical protein [Leptospira sp. 96542]
MSFIERSNYAVEEKEEAAFEILLKVGYFKRCSEHEEVVMTSGTVAQRDAYRYGNSHWNHYSGIFKNRKEMTAAIKRVSENPDYSSRRCYECERHSYRA